MGSGKQYLTKSRRVSKSKRGSDATGEMAASMVVENSSP